MKVELKSWEIRIIKAALLCRIRHDTLDNATLNLILLILNKLKD